MYWDCPVSVLLCSSGCQSRSHTASFPGRQTHQHQQADCALSKCRVCRRDSHPWDQRDLSFKFSKKREVIKYLYQLSASHAAFFLRTHVYCRRYLRITESQNFLCWKTPVRSSSPAINPAESINSLINRFELANIWPYDYAVAVPEGRIKIQNMKQLDGHLDNDVKTIELKWIPLFASSGLFLALDHAKCSCWWQQ